MSEFMWLEIPLHKNIFSKFKLDENEGVLETLKTTPDGSIMAVRRDKVEKICKEIDLPMIRAGYKKIPDKFKVEDEESFYKYIAYHLEED